jgi:hypothetical protein
MSELFAACRASPLAKTFGVGPRRRVVAGVSRAIPELSPAQFTRRGGRTLSECQPQNLRPEDGQRPSRRVVILWPKQSPSMLLAQFSLSRERDVANIIADEYARF